MDRILDGCQTLNSYTILMRELSLSEYWQALFSLSDLQIKLNMQIKILEILRKGNISDPVNRSYTDVDDSHNRQKIM